MSIRKSDDKKLAELLGLNFDLYEFQPKRNIHDAMLLVEWAQANGYRPVLTTNDSGFWQLSLNGVSELSDYPRNISALLDPDMWFKSINYAIVNRILRDCIND